MKPVMCIVYIVMEYGKGVRIYIIILIGTISEILEYKVSNGVLI